MRSDFVGSLICASVLLLLLLPNDKRIRHILIGYTAYIYTQVVCFKY
jgi:hypothetical protein